MSRTCFQLSLILLFALSACREEFELDGPAHEPRLVVDGRITSEYLPHSVFLSLSGGYQNEGQYEKATGAYVEASDGINTFVLEETEPGTYVTDSLAGVPGRTYTLRIEWGGALFEASDTMGAIPPAFAPVSFVDEGAFRTMEYRRHQFGFPEANEWQVQVGPPDSLRQPTFTSALGQQIGVEVDTLGAYTFSFFTHPNIEVNGLMNFEEAHFYGFKSNRTVIQKRLSLSRAQYEYLRALFMETEWRGTLFDSTPGEVKGNVSNGAFGFFSAQAVRSLSFEI